MNDVWKFTLKALATGLLTALGATIYSLAVRQVTTDEPASQRARMVHLLSEISKKLDGGGLGSFKIGTRSVDDIKPIDIDKLSIGYEEPQYYQRELLVGAKLYKISIYLSGLADAGLQAENIKKIDWTFDGENMGTTFEGVDSLFLSKIKKPLLSFLTSKKSFDVTAQVWLNEKIAEAEGINNPLELKVKIPW